MRILLIYQFCTFGGVERVVLNRAEAFREAGQDATIDMLFLKDLGGLASFRHYIEERSLASVVKVHLHDGEIAASVPLHEYDLIFSIDTPSVFSQLSGYDNVFAECHTPYRENRQYLRELPDFLRSVVVPSEAFRRKILLEVPVTTRIHVLHNPVSELFFDSAPLPPRKNPRRPVVYMARLDLLKNIAEVLDIFRACMAREDLYLLIIGASACGPDFTERLKSLGLLRRCVLRERIAFEAVPRFLRLLKAHRGLFISPSRDESFGMAVAECIASRVPLLASDIPAHRELLSSDSHFLYALGDVVEARDKIFHLLDHWDHFSSRVAVYRDSLRAERFLRSWQTFLEDEAWRAGRGTPDPVTEQRVMAKEKELRLLQEDFSRYRSAADREREKLRNEIREHRAQVLDLSREQGRLKVEIQRLKACSAEREGRITDLANERDRREQTSVMSLQRLRAAESELEAIKGSLTWRLGQVYGKHLYGRGIHRLIGGMAERLASHHEPRMRGRNAAADAPVPAESRPGDAAYAAHQETLRSQLFRDRPTDPGLRDLVARTNPKGIFVYPSPITWDVPLFQRPHQMLMELSRRGYLAFFVTPDPAADGVKGIRSLNPYLHVIGDMGALRALHSERVTLLISWTPMRIVREIFPRCTVVYDWIDELDVFHLYCGLMEKDHQELLRTADIVLASATSLYEKARAVTDRVRLAPNGVRIEDFRIDTPTLPADMKAIHDEGRPVVGFYGSLEGWRMDYDLVNHLARACRDLTFVLIGPSYDGSATRIEDADNVYLLGPKKYTDLKHYLACFDVAIIPYKVYRVTESVFPVKLCEFMAGGAPIVTTDLRECRNFRSVLISRSYDEFVGNVRKALLLSRDSAYRGMVIAEAGENTWGRRVDVLIEALESVDHVHGPAVTEAAGEGGERGDAPAEDSSAEAVRVRAELAAARAENARLAGELAMIRSSDTWKIATHCFRIIDRTPPLSASVNALKRLRRRAADAGTAMPEDQPEAAGSRTSKVLDSLIASHAAHAKGVILYPPTVDWNLPLFQRPQHLAVQLARLGYLSFYCTANHTYDRVHGVEQVDERLYLTDTYDLLTQRLRRGWVIVSSISSITIEDIMRLRGQGLGIIYDYLDEIHPDISGVLTNYFAARHAALDPSFIDLVLTISRKLYDEMRSRFPAEKVLLFPNGVDYEHFHIARDRNACPEDLLPVVAEGKPVIGYHGALAQWIDYDLLNYVALRRRDWHILLIGWDYDGSMKALADMPNITYLGIKKYPELPRYSIWFDAAMIPFREGDVARSTSPIKLYEYMAMNTPVVVTKDLVECHGYKSVLKAESKDDFIRKVEEALALRGDPAFLRVVDEEARANTWKSRAAALDGILTSTRRIRT